MFFRVAILILICCSMSLTGFAQTEPPPAGGGEEGEVGETDTDDTGNENDPKEPSLRELLGGTQPMIAVLFSSQDRNTFEVVRDPAAEEATIGIINQSHEGSTAGLLIAYEAPLALPKVKWPGNPYKSRMPIGAWFGVNLKTGDGDEIADVDLAAGLSVSLISKETEDRLRNDRSPGLRGSARLLLGLIYGEVTTLGPRDASTNFNVGDPYPLGETPPLNKERKISVTYGIGFRF